MIHLIFQQKQAKLFATPQCCGDYINPSGSLTTRKSGGINCGTHYTKDYIINMQATLTTLPADDYNFNGWQDDCFGITPKTTVTLENVKTGAVAFAEIPHQAPTTAFSIFGQAPLTIALDGSTSTDADGNIVSFAWAHSDGQSVNGETVEFIFDEADG